MIWILVSGVTLIAAGMFLLGAFCHRAVERALRWLLVKLMPSDGDHAPGADKRRYDRLPETPVDLLGSEETAHTVAGDLISQRATGLLTSEQVTGYADVIWQESEQYLPPPPVSVDRPVERFHADGDPFTGSQPVLDDDAMKAIQAENDRRWYLRSHLTDYAGMTDDDIREDMRRVYAGKHAIAAALMLEPLPLAAEAGAQMARQP